MMSRLYSWYGKAVVRSAFLVIVVLAVLAIFVTKNADTPIESFDNAGRQVTVASVASFGDTGTIDLIGSVSAVREATIQSEAAGQVTRVDVSLGDFVRAGAIIGQIENASERAQVLQAQGVYEAALAAAAQADSGTGSAEVTLSAAKDSSVTTYRAAYTTVDDAIRNTVDILFSNPTSIPGFRLNGLGQATMLNADRQNIEQILSAWSSRVSAVGAETIATHLSTAAQDIETIVRFVENLSLVVSNKNNDDRVIDGTTIATIRSSMTSVRSTLNTTRQNVQTAATAIENAEAALTRAQISGTANTVSSANAAVKQALGALRGAEANLEKTLFRTPVSGSVNVLDIKVGDFVSAFTPIAQVTNNDGFEIKTAVSEAERNRISIGSVVRIGTAYEGVITAIAPAVNPTTKKVEVRIAVDSKDLRSGDTVRVVIPTANENKSSDRIIIPVAALKVETDRIIVFTVEEGVLRPHEVTVGPLVGENIIILEGLMPNMSIVTDARGLNQGERVTVATN